MTTSNILKDRLSPILKWAGGKEQELKYIHPAMPKKKFNNYYEPFVGGGAVYFSINSNKVSACSTTGTYLDMLFFSDKLLKKYFTILAGCDSEQKGCQLEQVL